MRGNSQVRFLGEGGAVMHHPYPTCGRYTNLAKASTPALAMADAGFFLPACLTSLGVRHLQVKRNE